MGNQGQPLILGINLTDHCNLHCQHCIFHSGQRHLSTEQSLCLVRDYYRKGARILFLQGGEVFLWPAGRTALENLIAQAKHEGYFQVAITTNGTYPIETGADLVWVSLDGTKKNHNRIRGDTYDQIIQNLRTSSHRKITLNMTINGLNYKDIEAVATVASSMTSINGVSYNFHTPFFGTEDLMLSLEDKRKCVDRIIHLKRQGYPVINSYAALRAQKTNNYTRPVSLIVLIEQGRAYPCCFGRVDPEVCKKCGYGIIAELSLLARGNINVIREALKLFS